MANTDTTSSVHRPGYSSSTGSQTESMMETANEVRERANEVAGDLAETIKEHPYATIALAAGLAFAIGALWKIQANSRRSQLEQWMSYLPNMNSNSFRSYWR